jgi:hypothetical protein
VSHFRGDSRAKKGHDLQQERRLAALPCQPSRLRVGYLDAFETFCHDAGAGLAGGQSHESASARCWYLKEITIKHTKELQ